MPFCLCLEPVKQSRGLPFLPPPLSLRPDLPLPLLADQGSNDGIPEVGVSSRDFSLGSPSDQGSPRSGSESRTAVHLWREP